MSSPPTCARCTGFFPPSEAGSIAAATRGCEHRSARRWFFPPSGAGSIAARYTSPSTMPATPGSSRPPGRAPLRQRLGGGSTPLVAGSSRPPGRAPLRPDLRAAGRHRHPRFFPPSGAGSIAAISPRTAATGTCGVLPALRGGLHCGVSGKDSAAAAAAVLPALRGGLHCGEKQMELIHTQAGAGSSRPPGRGPLRRGRALPRADPKGTGSSRPPGRAPLRRR